MAGSPAGSPEEAVRTSEPAAVRDLPLHLLRCPCSGGALAREPDGLRSPQGHLYRVGPAGIPLFICDNLSEDARRQQAHYDWIARAYEANLTYPHTRAYLDYLDEGLFAAIGSEPLGTMAEICCGLGAAVEIMDRRYTQAVGIDISFAMLERAARQHAGRPVVFVQGDATNLPLADGAFDTVVMLGGIHHVNDRPTLFREVARVLRPGGRFIFREPVDDFFAWRWLRAMIYRISPMLDHGTERPLLWRETVPPLQTAGLEITHWTTHGFIGFCLFMNSDVLFFNRFFRFVPRIAAIVRAVARLDALTLSLPGLRHAGLQVIGVAKRAHDV